MIWVLRNSEGDRKYLTTAGEQGNFVWGRPVGAGLAGPIPDRYRPASP